MNIVTTIAILFFFNISFTQVNNSNVLNKDLQFKVTSILKTPENAKKHLGIRIFSSEIFDSTIIKDLIYQIEFDGLLSVLVLNLDEGIKTINREEIKHWKFDDEKLFLLARSQTKNNLKDILFQKIDISDSLNFFVSINEENYFINSLLLFPQKLVKYDLDKEGIVIGIPSRGVCTIMPINLNNSIYEDLSVYYYFLKEVYNNSESPTSMLMFLYKNENYYPIVPIEDENKRLVRFVIPEILQHR
jgi:hypothetical protein